MPRPLRILIAEDEAILAEDLRGILEQHGYQVVDTVDNADDACRIAAAARPDLVMMDVHLAGERDGIAAAECVGSELGLPVIFLTAHSDPATLERAKGASPYGYLVKPFDNQDLRAAIETTVHRHRADTQLRQMEQWLRTTLHSIGDGIITLDLDRRVTFLNPIAEQLTGWSPRDAVGQPADAVFAVRDASGQPVTHLIAPVLNAGETRHLDENFRIVTKSGDPRRINTSVTPIRAHDGTTTGAIIIFRDATEKWELQQLQRKQLQREQETQRLESLGVLASGIAHDFNNLLAIIMGHAELLSDNPKLAGNDLGAVNQIRDAARRASNLCEQMLNYADTAAVENRPTALGPLIERIAQRFTPSMRPAVQLSTTFPADLPSALGHSGRLQQLFSNVLLNAIEAMDDRAGRITVTARQVNRPPPHTRLAAPEGPPPPGWICVAITDEGHGMSPDVVDRIFDPFFSTKFAGRGLGMSIVFNVTRLHGGALGLTTAPGLGTRIDVYLPAAAVEAPKTSAPPPRAEWRPRHPGHVLIIDDEAQVRRILSEQVRRLGLTADDTASPDVALAVVKARTDLRIVFLDLTMPEITGIEMLRRIRLTHRDLPIVFISGFSIDSISDVLATDPRAFFLHKPFVRTDLVSVLAKVMD